MVGSRRGNENNYYRQPGEEYKNIPGTRPQESIIPNTEQLGRDIQGGNMQHPFIMPAQPPMENTKRCDRCNTPFNQIQLTTSANCLKHYICPHCYP